MNKISPVIWFFIFLIILLPSAVGRFLLDVAGSLLFLFLLLPIFITGAGWIGWKILQSKMQSCDICGTSFLKDNPQCPVCGAISIQEKNTNSSSRKEDSIPASSVTIDITPKDKKII
tara:strand:+ start:25980 stop:26330 length:351 start_codon:yes stop_codon:yes gene_type:complete